MPSVRRTATFSRARLPRRRVPPVLTQSHAYIYIYIFFLICYDSEKSRKASGKTHCLAQKNTYPTAQKLRFGSRVCICVLLLLLLRLSVAASVLTASFLPPPSFPLLLPLLAGWLLPFVSPPFFLLSCTAARALALHVHAAQQRSVWMGGIKQIVSRFCFFVFLLLFQ